MSSAAVRASRVFDVGCTVRASNTMHELSAHVELDGDLEVGPGDRVHVHGGPISPEFGESLVERRQATVTRAGWFSRMWSRCTGDLACMHLLEVSFTDRRST